MVDYMPEWIERGNLRYDTEGVLTMCRLLSGESMPRRMQKIDDDVNRRKMNQNGWCKNRRRK